jgi:hypothetical protein
VASSTGSAIGSDTLSAQVTPKKSSGPVVLAAVGIVVLIAFGAYLAFRGPDVKREPATQPPPPVVTGEAPTSAPSTGPAVEPTVSAKPPPTASVEEPPSVETQTAKHPRPAVPRPASTGKGKPGKPTDDDLMDSRK